MNEPLTDFSRPAHRAAFQEAIRQVRGSLGKSYPFLIGNQRISGRRTLWRENPSHRKERVGQITLGDSSHAEMALTQCEETASLWARVPIAERARILQRAADLLKERRFELAAWEVLEVGKPWVEADADVVEAIDSLRYYAEEMLRWTEETRIGQVPGERNLYRREPLGPGVVISPWNFPLAIPAGMTGAALVTGNTLVLKPAEQSSIVDFHLVELLLKAGIPPGVVNLLHGLGPEVGDALVRSPRVRWIAFTGSKEVGLRIIERSAVTPPGQGWVKRVIAEMGGKNAIIVDRDADLDEAVLGVAASAFGYQGQKCSACSRVILLKEIERRFLERLIETARSLPVGPAEEPGTVIGPMVDQEALSRVRRYIELGKKEGGLAFEGDVPDRLDGYFAGPAIFTGVSPRARIAQEEIFGPVLATLRASSFDEAIEIANGVPYALTGGVYSRSPAHIEQAKERFRAGNLYINRKITGAVVGRQPFGGLGLSGAGQKAGGPDTLLQFLQGRTITENTLRHGIE
ncbi:MAG: L-glutamate gamma-semialdehyde dehydrogenase [Candidatus Omnitrophica bacterium]|nr:L-glutamate gamma-semialdehyde dehydrogenase [Candidatus Omnitrophota bacterium]